ncbi:MAG TPA: MFS transporter [Cellulomonas sp.]
MRADVRDGLRLLWHQPVLRALSVLTAGFNFASAGVVAVLVLYAVGPDSALGLSASGYGLLLTASAAGSLLGSFVAAPAQERIGRTRTLALGMVASVLFLGGPALTTEPLAVGVAAAVGGAGIALVNVVAVTLRQQVTPDAKLGRVIGAHRLLAWGTKPLGAAAGGVLAELLGLRAVFVVMAALVLALLVLLRALSERALHAAEGGGPGTPPGVQMHVQTHEEGPSE